MSDEVFAKRALQNDVLRIDTGKMLDNNNAHEMVATINEALEAGYHHIILDMGHLEFLSSAGVGSILGTVEMARRAGGDIILCDASPTILHVLEVLDLSDYLTIKADREEAAAVCGMKD